MRAGNVVFLMNARCWRWRRWLSMCVGMVWLEWWMFRCVAFVSHLASWRKRSGKSMRFCMRWLRLTHNVSHCILETLEAKACAKQPRAYSLSIYICRIYACVQYNVHTMQATYEHAHIHTLSAHGTSEFWGYFDVGWFAPDSYASMRNVA